MISTDIDESFPDDTEQFFSYFCIGLSSISVSVTNLGSIQFYPSNFFLYNQRELRLLFSFTSLRICWTLASVFLRSCWDFFSEGLPADFSLYFLLIFQYAFLFLPEQGFEIVMEFLNAVILHTHTDRIDDQGGGGQRHILLLIRPVRFLSV